MVRARAQVGRCQGRSPWLGRKRLHIRGTYATGGVSRPYRTRTLTVPATVRNASAQAIQDVSANRFAWSPRRWLGTHNPVVVGSGPARPTSEAIFLRGAANSSRLHIAHWIGAEHAGRYSEPESTPQHRLGLASHRRAGGRAHGPKRRVDAGWRHFADTEPADDQYEQLFNRNRRGATVLHADHGTQFRSWSFGENIRRIR